MVHGGKIVYAMLESCRNIFTDASHGVASFHVTWKVTIALIESCRRVLHTLFILLPPMFAKFCVLHVLCCMRRASHGLAACNLYIFNRYSLYMVAEVYEDTVSTSLALQLIPMPSLLSQR